MPASGNRSDRAGVVGRAVVVGRRPSENRIAAGTGLPGIRAPGGPPWEVVPEPAVVELGVGENVGWSSDLGGSHTVGPEDVDDLVSIVAAEERIDLCVEFVPVVPPCALVPVSLVRDQVRPPYSHGKPVELGVGHHAERHMSVAAGTHDERIRLGIPAGAFADNAECQARERRLVDAQHRLHRADIDMLALSRATTEMQGRLRGDRGRVTADVAAEVLGSDQWLSVRFARDRQVAARRPRGQGPATKARIGAGCPEGARRDVHAGAR